MPTDLTWVDWTRLEAAEALEQPALLFLGPRVFDRDFAPHLRQFLCACCRELDEWLDAEALRALEVIEHFAAGRASFEELVAARDSAKVAARRAGRRFGLGSRVHAAHEAVRDAARNHAFESLLLCCRAARRAGLTTRQQGHIFERMISAMVVSDERLA
jgi:hypothetical protein